MKNRKSIAFFLVAVIVLSLAHVMIRRHAPGSRPASDGTLLELPESVSGILIQRKGVPDAFLSHEAEWRIEEPYRGRADEGAVASLLDKLAFTPVMAVIADAELFKIGRTHADFSLADPIARISVSVPDGRKTVVSFGAPTPSADGVYAAIDGVDAVLIVPTELFAAVDRTADAYRSRSLVRCAAEAVSSFDIKRGTGSIVSFNRGGSGWTVGTERASDAKVGRLLSMLTAASAIDFVWPIGASNETERASVSLLAGYGLDPESAVTVILKGADGSDRQVAFGKDASEKTVYASVHGASAVVTVPTALRDAVLQDPVMFTDSRLFPVAPNSVAAFSIVDGDVTYALSRDAGGSWRLESPIAAPADPKTVGKVLGRLLALSPTDVTVAPSGLSVSVSTNSAPMKVARASVLGDLRIDDLRSLDVVRIDPVTIKRIVRTPGKESEGKPTAVVFDRERRTWNVETATDGAVADEKGIARVLSAVNSLSALRVDRLKVVAADLDDYGLDHPFLTVAFDSDQGAAVRRNILIGEKTSGGRFATVGSSDAVFVVSDAALEPLVSPLVGD